MRAVKIVSILILVYVGIVVTFESLLGFFQPEAQSTLIITTMDEDGTGHDRVVARLESNGQLYVARNHWPRAWYSRALENPNVRVTMDGRTGDYLAVPASDEEHSRVNSDYRLGTVFRLLTGFPPRYFWFLAQMYARFSPQQVVHAGRRGCGCARGRYSAGKSSVAQSTAACAAPLLVGGLLGGSQLDRKVLRRWHLQGDEP